MRSTGPFSMPSARWRRSRRSRREQPVRAGGSLTGRRCLELFDAQLASRHLDLAARYLRAGAGYYTIGSAGHEANAASRRRCGRPTRRCCTTAPAPSICPGRAGARRRRRSGMSCSGWSAAATSRSPAAGTRSSATPICTSSRRPRPSPRTCRGPSASPSPSVGRPKLGVTVVAVRTPSRWPASATPRPTTPPPPARSTPPATSPIRACRCRCCWSARTTAWGSACGRRPAGSRPPTGRPGAAYFTADGMRPGRPASTPRPGRRLRPGQAARPRSCTCGVVRLPGPRGSDAEISYRSPAEIAADLARDPLLGTARLLVGGGPAQPGRGHRPVRGDRAARSARRREAVTHRRLASAGRGDGAARAAPPDQVARARPGRWRTGPARAPSAAGCRKPPGPLTLADSD